MTRQPDTSKVQVPRADRRAKWSFASFDLTLQNISLVSRPTAKGFLLFRDVMNYDAFRLQLCF